MSREISTFMDGEDCSECASLERDIKKLKSKNAEMLEALKWAEQQLSNEALATPTGPSGNVGNVIRAAIAKAEGK